MRKSFSLQFAWVSHLLSLETIFLLGTIISIYQQYSYETSILLPKVIIGTLFLSHSLTEMNVSGVKLKHVNMFRQVPQTLLEFLDHCFRQHAASLWVETSHPKDTGQSILKNLTFKSTVHLLNEFKLFSWPFASLFDRIALITLHTQISHCIPCQRA